MRKKIVAGNWKMNCDLPETQRLLSDLKTGLVKGFGCEIMVAPSHPFLYTAFDSTLETQIEVIAQDASAHEKGAHTGEVSIDMLQSVGIKTVILGHSERRSDNHETDELLAEKVKTAVAKGMRVIFCVGEKLEDRKAEKQQDIVGQQVKTGLFHLSEKQMEQVVIAYEPVWAIGTGETASPEQAQEMHAFIRQQVEQQYDAATAHAVRILYGGSVKPANAMDIFSQADVDGGLIGGASLNADSFFKIINAAED